MLGWNSLDRLARTGVALLAMGAFGAQAASDTGVAFDRSQYNDRPVLEDFTAAPCPTTPRGLTQIKGNLYRHTTGAGLAVHSGFVLITDEGALVIDPASTCTSGWLLDEIKQRFNQPIRYVVMTHAHADHISGAQIFQNAGAVVVANQRAIEPIVGEKLPTAIPDRVFDKSMTIVLGGETIELNRIAPSHSDSMIMVSFPAYKALQCTDICENKTPPYMDFLDFYYDGWIETLDWVISQNVDIIDIGHYTPATIDDQKALRNYMIDLHAQVLSLVRQGQSWDQLWRNVKFSDEAKSWTAFEAMKTANILGMHRWVTNHRRGAW